MPYSFEQNRILNPDGKHVATFADGVDFDAKDAFVHDLKSGHTVNNPREKKSQQQAPKKRGATVAGKGASTFKGVRRQKS